MRTPWHKFLVVFLLCVGVFAGAVAIYQIRVDPFGVWGFSPLSGYNNFKSAQEKNERLFKIYQYEKAKPDVLLIGSSRLNYCTPAKWPGVPDDLVYNMGINAVHIPEEKLFFEHALKTHRPKIVAIGIDLLQFSSRYNHIQKGYSEERMAAVSTSSLSAMLFKLRETVYNFDAIIQSKEVIDASMKNPRLTYHERGWDKMRLETPWPGRSKYRQILFRYHTKTYRLFRRSQKNYVLFFEMVKAAKEKGINIVMYINPVSIDFLTCYEVNGIWSEFERMKRRLVKLGPVWDFNYVNDITIDRENFIDPSHFKATIGEKITSLLAKNASDRKDDFGVLLTHENVKKTLRWQRDRYEQWMLDNPESVEMLKEARKTKNRRLFNNRAIRIIGK